MKSRFFTFFLLLCVLSVFADKKMTIRNSDTGESFDITVPDGMRIYEYNSNWLDSIPYLLERARNGEPWAFEALGDCYRFGKGGVDRSAFRAIAYYDLSGMDIDEKSKELIAENPKDIVGLVYKLIGVIERNNYEKAICILDTLKSEGYDDAEVIRDFLREPDRDELLRIAEQNIKDPEADTDKSMFTILGCFSFDSFPDSFKGDEIIALLTNKFPLFYDIIAVSFFRDDHEQMDSIELAEKTQKFISFLEAADNEAMLSREGAGILYRHYLSEAEAGRIAPDVENMRRLAILAHLQETETLVFSDK